MDCLLCGTIVVVLFSVLTPCGVSCFVVIEVGIAFLWPFNLVLACLHAPEPPTILAYDQLDPANVFLAFGEKYFLIAPFVIVIATVVSCHDDFVFLD